MSLFLDFPAYLVVKLRFGLKEKRFSVRAHNVFYECSTSLRWIPPWHWRIRLNAIYRLFLLSSHSILWFDEKRYHLSCFETVNRVSWVRAFTIFCSKLGTEIEMTVSVIFSPIFLNRLFFRISVFQLFFSEF